MSTMTARPWVNGWHEAHTQGRRARTYQVYFAAGEPIAVRVKVNDTHWRATWHRSDGPATITAACAIRAAIAKARGEA